MMPQHVVDPAVMAEVIAANIEASKAEPICLRCDDTGTIEHPEGWGLGTPCNCDAGGDLV